MKEWEQTQSQGFKPTVCDNTSKCILLLNTTLITVFCIENKLRFSPIDVTQVKFHYKKNLL